MSIEIFCFSIKINHLSVSRWMKKMRLVEPLRHIQTFFLSDIIDIYLKCISAFSTNVYILGSKDIFISIIFDWIYSWNGYWFDRNNLPNWYTVYNQKSTLYRELHIKSKYFRKSIFVVKNSAHEHSVNLTH